MTPVRGLGKTALKLAPTTLDVHHALKLVHGASAPPFFSLRSVVRQGRTSRMLAARGLDVHHAFETMLAAAPCAPLALDVVRRVGGAPFEVAAAALDVLDAHHTVRAVNGACGRSFVAVHAKRWPSRASGIRTLVAG